MLDLQNPNKTQEYFNDSEVKKNYWIGYMAKQLKETAKLLEQDKLDEGITILSTVLKESDLEFPHLMDEDLLRVKGILTENMDRLNNMKGQVNNIIIK